MLYPASTVRASSASAISSNRGAVNPIVPILGAFAFFVLFLTISLWFIGRSRSPQVPQPSAPSNFPVVPPSPPSGASSSSPNATISPGFTSPPSGQSPVQSPSPFSNSSPSQQPTSLDSVSARQVVESWLSYKKTIFSDPYDLSAIDNYIVNPGPLYSDIAKVGGSVDWLRSNKSSYYYNDLKILDVSDFRQFPDRAHLTVRVLEDLELRTPRGVDRSKSGRKTQSWVYELKLHNGRWLVYDYRKDI